MYCRIFTNSTKNLLVCPTASTNFSVPSGFCLKRDISNAELSNVLRPFYFAVHPDLFGQHPEQRIANEESLKHLSAFLEAKQKQKMLTSAPSHLTFYVRESDSRDKFRQVKIYLEHHLDIKRFVKSVLESCSLPTANVEKLKEPPKAKPSSTSFSGGRDYYAKSSSNFQEYDIFSNIHRAQQERTLRKWLDKNIQLSRTRSNALQSTRDEVSKLEIALVQHLELKGIRYDCGWNIEHIRGCLKSLDHLSKTYEMKELKGRVVILAQASGVSLDGDVMLFTGDVQHNWLDFIKNIPKQDEYLKRTPDYERALSQVMRNIRIARRKFMPKAQVVNYASYLCKVTTTMLDYLTAHSSYPKSWPESLDEFELVVESEAAPLMVSPTGQFITPSACPGTILIDFLTTHMPEARQKAKDYDKNKHVERELHQECKEKFKLKQLTKDDSIDPNKMIECLKRLLDANVEIENCILHITNYYSVLTDGTVCIPWNWTLE